MADQTEAVPDFGSWGVIEDQPKPDNMISSDLTGDDALRALAAKDPEKYGYLLEGLRRKQESANPQPASQPDDRSVMQKVRDAASGISTWGMLKGAGQSAVNAATLPGSYLSGSWPHYDKEGNFVTTPPPNLNSEAGVEAVTDAALNITNIGPGTAFKSIASVPAQRAVQRAIAEDIRVGRSRGLSPTRGVGGKPTPLPGAYPEELQILADEGIPVSAYDLSGGEGLKRLVEDAAKKSPKAQEAAKRLQDMMAERTASANEYLGATIDRMAGKELSFGDEFAAAVQRVSDTNDPNYTAVFSMPGNSAIMTPELHRMAAQSPTIRDAISEANRPFLDRGQAEPLSFDRQGNLIFDPSNPPPLEYWDRIYRAIRDQSGALYDAGKSSAGKDYKDVANRLRVILDDASEKLPNGNSSYKMIRDEASDVFGARNALEAGYKYITMSPHVEATKAATALRQIAANPDHYAQFQTGILSRIKEDALKNPNKFTSYFDGSNPAVSAKLRTVLGDDAYERLSNQANLQRIIGQNKIFDIDPATGRIVGNRHPIFETIVGTSIGVAPFTEAGQRVIQTAMDQGGPMAVGAAAGIIGAGAAKRIISSLKSSYERQKAEEIIRIINSRDPAAFERIQNANPSMMFHIVRMLGIPTAMAEKSALTSGQMTAPAREDAFSDWQVIPPSKAAGGRIYRKSGGKVSGNPISAEVRRVRALLSEKTASMLSVPDDAIATALHIAKGT